MTFPFTIKIVAPNDARGWIGFGCFLLVLVVLGMIAADSSLLQNDAFLILATAIVITGWVNGPVGWAYQATKGGGEAAESSARIAEQAATAALKTGEKGPAGTPEDPVSVAGAASGEKPVDTKASRA